MSAKSNGHPAASQIIPPMITRVITRDILNGRTTTATTRSTDGHGQVVENSQVQMVWTRGGELPVYSQAKIIKMLFIEEPYAGIEVYSLGMIENQMIGCRTTLRIEDVLCVDEVMDPTTMSEEIRLAEEDGDDEDEPDDPEELDDPVPTALEKPVQPETPALTLPTTVPPTTNT